mmetsp:Transcript_9268/g.29535  ORF Transcript_9268/g.29535 Transcript_9268/m.29535 type:complete len:334 (-) Transcript_9268:36-1037(-)
MSIDSATAAAHIHFGSLPSSRRLDGRSSEEVRPVTVQAAFLPPRTTTGAATALGVTDKSGWGSSCAEVAMGGSRVRASVSADIGPSAPGRGYAGVVRVRVQLWRGANPRFHRRAHAPQPSAGLTSLVSTIRRGAPLGSEPSFGLSLPTRADQVSPAELERLLLKSLQGSNALDVESLVIVANTAAWHINILVTVVEDDGALLDASSLAVLSALRAFRRPDVSIVDGVVRVLPMDRHVPVPVALNHHPVCVTFAVGATGDVVNPAILVDPTANESIVFPGYLVIAVNEHAQVAFVHQGGVGVEIDPNALLTATAEAVKVAAARYAVLVANAERS